MRVRASSLVLPVVAIGFAVAMLVTSGAAEFGWIAALAVTAIVVAARRPAPARPPEPERSPSPALVGGWPASPDTLPFTEKTAGLDPYAEVVVRPEPARPWRPAVPSMLLLAVSWVPLLRWAAWPVVALYALAMLLVVGTALAVLGRGGRSVVAAALAVAAIMAFGVVVYPTAILLNGLGPATKSHVLWMTSTDLHFKDGLVPWWAIGSLVVLGCAAAAVHRVGAASLQRDRGAEVARKRWHGRVDRLAPNQPEAAVAAAMAGGLRAIPAARFFRCAGRPVDFVVASGTNVALVVVAAWPPGEYVCWTSNSDITRDGQLFVAGEARVRAAERAADALRRRVEREMRAAPPAREFTIRTFVTVAAEGGRLTLPAARDDRVVYTDADTLVSALGWYLAGQPYTADAAVLVAALGFANTYTAAI